MTIKNKIHVQEFLYDFAKDGGTAGTFVLSNKNGRGPIPVGAIIKSVTAQTVTALTADGAATLIWGNGADADGFSGPTIAVASFTLNSLFNGWDNAAALLWDDANDHPIPYYVDSAANGAFNLVVATANITAGKIVFMVEYYLPAIDV